VGIKEMDGSDYVTVNLDNMTSVIFHEGKLLLICKNTSSEASGGSHEDLLGMEVYEINQNIFNRIFSNIIYSNGKFGFMSADRKHVLPLNTEDTKFMEAVGVTQTTLDRAKSMTDDKNGYMELVKAAGLSHEHCIIFVNQILFHSPNLDEFEKFRREINPHIGVSEYHPVSSKFFESKIRHPVATSKQ